MDDRSRLADEILELQGELLHAALVSGAEFWAKLNLTMPQLKVLLLLGQQGNATVSWLAGRMNVSPPNVTGILDRLETRNLVQRTADRQDRRVVRIVLTPDGSQLLKQMASASATRLREALGRINQREQEALREGLLALARASRAS